MIETYCILACLVEHVLESACQNLCYSIGDFREHSLNTPLFFIESGHFMQQIKYRGVISRASAHQIFVTGIGNFGECSQYSLC